MRSRDEFVEKFKHVVAGGFLFGFADQQRLSSTAMAEKAGKMYTAREVEALLGQMFDWLQGPQWEEYPTEDDLRDHAHEGNGQS